MPLIASDGTDAGAPDTVEIGVDQAPVTSDISLDISRVIR
jgi:hypothetical protein